MQDAITENNQAGKLSINNLISFVFILKVLLWITVLNRNVKNICFYNKYWE